MKTHLRLTRKQIKSFCPLTSAQCVILGVPLRGTGVKQIIGQLVSRQQLNHLRALRGLRRSTSGDGLIKDRGAILHRMGFETYVDYLHSELWKGIRERVYKHRGRTCVRCFEQAATLIHHEAYSEGTLKGERIHIRRWLWPLCSGCHEGRHFENGTWVRNFTKPQMVAANEQRNTKTETQQGT